MSAMDKQAVAQDRTWTHTPYDKNDETYFGCAKVVACEMDYIAKRRRAPDGWCSNLSGIALSGGGIRSASFSLGILQALSYAGWLKKIDYLSMVSGGSYIGGCLAWLLHKEWHGEKGERIPYGLERGNFPFGSYPMSGMADPDDALPGRPDWDVYKGRILGYLRQHASYLMPGNGINAWSLVAVVLRNTLFSIAAYGGLLVALFAMLGPFLFGLGDASLVNPATILGRLFGLKLNGALALAAVLGGMFLIWIPVYVIRLHYVQKNSKTSTGYQWRYAFERGSGMLLVLVCCFLVLGALPYVYDWAQSPPTASQPATFHVSGESSREGWFSMAGSVAQSSAAANPGRGIQAWFAGHIAPIVAAASTFLGMLSTLLGYFGIGKTKKIPLGFLVAAGCTFLIFGLLLASFSFALYLRQCDGGTGGSAACWASFLPAGFGVSQAVWAAVGLVCLFLLLVIADLNYLSIHRYYRDRLMETFTPDLPEALRVDGPKAGSDKSADGTSLAEIANVDKVQEPGPYPIINANIVLVSSRIPKFRGRGGDNFILTPLFCGSNATGWCCTRDERSPFNDMTLPTAIATSGAAIDPNTGCGGEGVTRSTALSFLMGFFNVRLGYWIENPTPPDLRMGRIWRYQKSDPAPEGQARDEPAAASRRWRNRLRRYLRRARLQMAAHSWWGGSQRPNVLYPGCSELFLRKNLDENSRMVQLSDGGHFENLGLYELIRRRLKLIIVCDGAAHPSFGFDDLGNAIEKVRADFGALIDIDCEDLKRLTPAAGPDGSAGYAEKGYLLAEITYCDRSKGTLIYLSATFYKELSADLYAYRKSHAEFPHQSTVDQFFDEKQFEAYRELGYQTAHRMMSDQLLVLEADIQATVGTPDLRCYRGVRRGS